jgi:regulator of cell morphogenesis and NO signaling
MIDKTLLQILELSPDYALKLHYLGINIFDSPQKTLAQICECAGLRSDLVLKELNNPSFSQNHNKFKELVSSSVETVMAYLRHSHRVFMRQKLPFMKNLIEKIEIQNTSSYKGVLEDLKIAFPLFCDDFVKHILEEENNIFRHISLLFQASKKKIPFHKLYFKMEKCSLIAFANHHELDDDDMQGIRDLTNNYHLTVDVPLMVKILYKELRSFETDLKNHAKIENKILIPKAIILESQIKKEFKKQIIQN